MNFFNKMKNKVLGFVKDEFLQAICASCALVAYADGSADEEEKQKMLQYMKLNDDLSHFGMNKIQESYDKYINMIEYDVNLGKIDCYKAIEKIKDERDNCNKLVAVCIAISKSDGIIDKDEKETIQKIASTLSVNLNNFTL